MNYLFLFIAGMVLGCIVIFIRERLHRQKRVSPKYAKDLCQPYFPGTTFSFKGSAEKYLVLRTDLNSVRTDLNSVRIVEIGSERFNILTKYHVKWEQEIEIHA